MHSSWERCCRGLSRCTGHASQLLFLADAKPAKWLAQADKMACKPFSRAWVGDPTKTHTPAWHKPFGAGASHLAKPKMSISRWTHQWFMPWIRYIYKVYRLDEFLPSLEPWQVMLNRNPLTLLFASVSTLPENPVTKINEGMVFVCLLQVLYVIKWSFFSSIGSRFLS
jgi:hypothetical protein